MAVDIGFKLDWDTYFITMCFMVAQKSKDPSTKHGCIVTTSDHMILSTGFNGPPRGFNDLEVPTERPIKYSFWEHSERNSIYAAARNGVNLKDSTFYITGYPCCDCLRAMIQVGAKRIVYSFVKAQMITEETIKVNNHLLQGQDIEFLEYPYPGEIFELIGRTDKYASSKYGV